MVRDTTAETSFHSQDLLIRAHVMRLAAEVPVCGVSTQTFLTETVATPHGTVQARFVRVPVKGLRADQIVREDDDSDIVLCWTQLPPETARAVRDGSGDRRTHPAHRFGARPPFALGGDLCTGFRMLSICPIVVTLGSEKRLAGDAA